MARKVVFVRGQADTVMIPLGRKLGIDAVVDCIITQDGEQVCKKEDCDTTIDGSAAIVEITEDNTLKLKANRSGIMQFRFVGENYVDLSDITTFEVRENLFGEVSNKKAGFIYYGVTTPTSVAEIESMELSRDLTFTIPQGRYVIACKREITAIVGEDFDYTNDFERSVVGDYNVYTFIHNTTIPMKFTVEFKKGE